MVTPTRPHSTGWITGRQAIGGGVVALFGFALIGNMGKPVQLALGGAEPQTNEIYQSIVQGLRAWALVAPKLPAKAEIAVPAASPQPPPFSSDDREFGGAVEPI